MNIFERRKKERNTSTNFYLPWPFSDLTNIQKVDI